MKRKFFIYILSFICVLISSLALTSCSLNNSGSDSVIEPTEVILYDISDDGDYARVIGYEGTATKIKIADTYNGLPVKTICYMAFSYKSIVSVIIPNSVTSISDYAFSGCNSLTSVTIPDSVTSIGNYAFHDCSSLTNVTMGNGVTAIGRYAFAYCDSLQFETHGNAKYLGNENNPYLALIEVVNTDYSSYTIHKNTKIIADYAFNGCIRVTSIIIPDGITHIGNEVFNNCSSLTSVTIPDSVTFIGIYAFSGCSSLTIYCKAETQPDGWPWRWNIDNCPVVWNYKNEK